MIKFLLERHMMEIPHTDKISDHHQDLPVWIKINSKKWVEDKISNDEFSIGIKWIIEHNIN